MTESDLLFAPDPCLKENNGSGPTRIMIVDDRMDDRELYRDLLTYQSDREFEFSEIERPDEAIDHCRLFNPDCILLDFRMPEKTGLDLLQELRSTPGLERQAVVMLSSQGNEGIAVEAMKRGCNDYLPKIGLTGEALVRAIDNAMEKAELYEKLERQREELERRSRVDDLTSLYNRRTILQILENELYRSSRYEMPLSVLMLDIDHFKQINDTYGHNFGDTVLRNIGSIIQKSLRVVDAAGRYGGEEFLIVLPGTDSVGAQIIAERIRNKISDRGHLARDGEAIRATASIGVASLESDVVTPEELLERSDRSLYDAKAEGRNCVQTWSETSLAEAQ